MSSGRASVAACALALLGAALGGCGLGGSPAKAAQPVVPPLVGTEPNGEQLRSGSQVIADARSSLTNAATVETSGTLALQGVSTPVDIVSERGGDLSGSLGTTKGALQIQFAHAPGTVYVRPTGAAAALVARLGLPAAVASPAPGGGFWALSDAASVAAVSTLVLPGLAATLLPSTVVATPAITSGDVDGTPVVIARYSNDGSGSAPYSGSVSVAVTGAARLVALTVDGGATALDVTVDPAVAPSLPTPAATPYP